MNRAAQEARTAQDRTERRLEACRVEIEREQWRLADLSFSDSETVCSGDAVKVTELDDGRWEWRCRCRLRGVCDTEQEACHEGDGHGFVLEADWRHSPEGVVFS